MIGDKIADRAGIAVDERGSGQRGKWSAAPGAVAVGGDHEAVGTGHGLTGVAKVADAPGGRMQDLAGVAVAWRLRQVDAVAEPVDHVEIVPRHAGIEERLTGRAGGDAMKADCRALKPVAQFCAGNEQAAERVRKAVEIGDVAQAQGACGNVGVMRGPAATAGPERSRGRQDRQAGVGGIGERLCEGGALGVVHKLRRRVVAQKREVAVQRGSTMAQRPVRQAQGMGVGGCERAAEARAGFCPGGGQQAGAMISDPPFSSGPRERQVELAKV
nr:hypothetical protein [Roseovarius azorensis]